MKHGNLALSADDMAASSRVSTLLDVMFLKHYGELAELATLPDTFSRLHRTLTASLTFQQTIAKVLQNGAESYRAWREQQLAPLISALANLVVADLTRGNK